jgi:hypothetical protein
MLFMVVFSYQSVLTKKIIIYNIVWGNFFYPFLHLRRKRVKRIGRGSNNFLKIVRNRKKTA